MKNKSVYDEINELISKYGFKIRSHSEKKGVLKIELHGVLSFSGSAQYHRYEIDKSNPDYQKVWKIIVAIEL